MEEPKTRDESYENGRENGESNKEEEEEGEKKVLQFLDSTDNYLTLFDSLSSSLRQGWLELASARHSMGSSRVTSSLFDLKLHPASTTLRVTQLDDGSTSRDPMLNQPHFTLSKWATSYDEKGSPRSRELQMDEEELDKKSNSPQLRRRGTTQVSSNDADKEQLASNMSSLTVDDQVEKERSKSLSVFGTLVSPKLRAAQVSFETALETLVEIANMRSLILSAYTEVKDDVANTK